MLTNHCNLKVCFVAYPELTINGSSLIKAEMFLSVNKKGIQNKEKHTSLQLVFIKNAVDKKKEAS